MNIFLNNKKKFITLFLIGVLTFWYWFATRLNRTFITKVQNEIAKESKQLDLAKLMDGNWETVCSIHGYDGSTYIKKYDRTYPPSCDAQDGVWGLTFIYPDGSYDSVSGSKLDGFDLDMGCRDKANAKLVRRINNKEIWVPINYSIARE